MSTTDFRNHLLFLEFKNPVFLPRRFTALDLIRHRLINLPALKHWHLFVMLPQIQKRSSGTRHDHSGKKLGYRKSYCRKLKLFRAQPFDPHSAQRISEHIEKEQFSLILFMFPVKHQDDEQYRAPH